MDVSMLDAAGQAFLLMMEPYRLAVLACGVLIGLAIGIIPGIGGLVGMALLLPFTYTMDPYTAIALLLGMSAVTGASDTIPAILFGVPGSASAQATILDGYPMTKRGEAGRALSAAYAASLLGGLFGALVLAVCIPALRPVVLYIGSPEMLAFSIFGISMVAVLSGGAPLRGLVAACIGIMLSMVGTDTQSGTLRWTMGNLYLWDGLPLVPMVLGLFALPEVAELAIKRMSRAQEAKYDIRSGMLQGIVDTLRSWWLVIRTGMLGAGVGAIPGLSGAVVDWLAYAHALQTEKGAKETFGTGDVRGVIGVESASNSITAGTLVPTIAFGVPGSPSMAILLGAFLIHGLVPGPDMLTTNLNFTYSMVWSIAIANILGAGICFMFSGQLARIALLRYTVLIPIILIVCCVGAFQASRAWGDLYTLLIFTIIGWGMKQLRWPRPPLVLGLILGAIIERYMFISIGRFGFEWLSRPLVMVLLALSVLTIAGPLVQGFRAKSGRPVIAFDFRRPRLDLENLLGLFFICVVGYMVMEASQWQFDARLAPMVVGTFALAVGTASFFYHVFRRRPLIAEEEQSKPQLMDIASDFSELKTSVLLLRAGIFMAWLIAFVASMSIIGLLPTVAVFVIAYMRLEGREPWKLTLGLTAGLMAFVYVVFDQIMAIPWPQTYLGSAWPALRALPTI